MDVAHSASSEGDGSPRLGSQCKQRCTQDIVICHHGHHHCVREGCLNGEIGDASCPWCLLLAVDGAHDGGLQEGLLAWSRAAAWMGPGAWWLAGMPLPTTTCHPAELSKPTPSFQIWDGDWGGYDGHSMDGISKETR
jgi:hypothetical protein